MCNLLSILEMLVSARNLYNGCNVARELIEFTVVTIQSRKALRLLYQLLYDASH